MIIKYYKGYIHMEKLRELTHTNKNGVIAYNLIEAAKNIGLDALGYKIDSLNKLNDITLPCIAFVTINKSFNHYVVIYEIDIKKEKILIADPASGIKKISFSEFKSIFNNIIIVLNKRNKIMSFNNHISYNQFVINVLKKHKTDFIKIVILSFLITLFSIITSFYTEQIINNINKILLFKIFYLFIFLYLFKNILDYIRNKILLKVHIKINKDLTNEIFSKIISLPYEYFKNRTTGEVITRFNDLNTTINTIIKIIVTVILDLSLTLFTMIFLIKINILLFIVSMIILLFYIFIIIVFNKKLLYKLKIIKEEKASINSYIIENINGFETIKGLALEEQIINKYKILNNENNKNIYYYEKIYNLEELFKNIVNETGKCILIFIAALLVIKNIISIGNLITFSYLYILFISPINNIINLSKDIKDSKLSYERINEILIRTKANTIYHNLPFKKITIKNLYYSYDNTNNILNNINLEINSNQKIMIMGDSGSGKSTILKLLKKYYQIENNKLFIDDYDINKLSLYEINKNISYVSQNEVLFSDTLYNNLILNRKITNKKIKKVIDDLKIDFINTNLNMIIEENGFNLSGGQKARIILARSLLNNFKILILDEIFSEMDINLERIILKNIFKRYHDKTIIVVSHRKNNLDLFDRYIEINNGNIINDVFKTSPKYKER